MMQKNKNSLKRIRKTSAVQYLKIHIVWLLLVLIQCVIFTSYAATTPIPVAPAKHPTKSAQHKSDLNYFLPQDKVTSLLAGPDSYLMIVNKNTHAINKGVMILIPEWEQGVIHPKASHFLQEKFPKNGWTTIAVLPPEKPTNFPSTEFDKIKQANENNLIMSQYTDKMSLLLQAVIKKAKTFPGNIFILSQGNNAAIIANILASKENSTPDEGNFTINGLILLSGYLHSDHNSIDKINTAFAQRLALSELPVLDLTLKHDHRVVKSKSDERKLLAKRERKVFYRHRILNNSAAGIYPEKTLISQIERWLVSIGW